MDNTFWLVDEQFLNSVEKELENLKIESNSLATFLIDKDGQLIGASKDTEDYDKTSLAALIAGNVAATGGLAKLLGEKEFSLLFHEGDNEHLHISIVMGKLILVVIFDDSTSLGLIRLRVKRAIKKFEIILNELSSKANIVEREGLFEDITEDDIENLFNEGG
jgi:predicted regulator of Ras-like GTPase activity (Roadblock/LC7/MglB family)